MNLSSDKRRLFLKSPFIATPCGISLYYTAKANPLVRRNKAEDIMGYQGDITKHSGLHQSSKLQTYRPDWGKIRIIADEEKKKNKERRRRR